MFLLHCPISKLGVCFWTSVWGRVSFYSHWAMYQKGPSYPQKPDFTFSFFGTDWVLKVHIHRAYTSMLGIISLCFPGHMFSCKQWCFGKRNDFVHQHLSHACASNIFFDQQNFCIWEIACTDKCSCKEASAFTRAQPLTASYLYGWLYMAQKELGNYVWHLKWLCKPCLHEPLRKNLNRGLW